MILPMSCPDDATDWTQVTWEAQMSDAGPVRWYAAIEDRDKAKVRDFVVHMRAKYPERQWRLVSTTIHITREVEEV